jgi:GNAT superfamily N-acetyltransferase
MAKTMKINEIKNLPTQFDTLVAEAVQDGHHFLTKMKEEWVNGKNRFGKDREVLLSVASESGDLVGVGGLNIDPYVADPSVGRVRHVYIAKNHRGQGAGKILVQRVIEHAKGQFKILRLRTHNPKAVTLYLSLGFTQVSNDDSTHSYMQMILADKIV